MTTPLLVTCDWLKQKIESDDLCNIVILDVSWSSTKDCLEDFKKCHIPGAKYINVLDAEHTEILIRNLPTTDKFTSMTQAVGVNTDSHVIVYSDSDMAGYFMSGRGWWTFKVFGHNNVSILDGGIRKWKQLGYSTTDQNQCQEHPGNFVATLCDSMQRDFEEVYRNSTSSEATFQLVDSRASSAYTDGHIPGAKSLTMATLIDDEEGVLKSKAQLKQLFTDSGVDLSKPVTGHCRGGMSSCTIVFAAHLLEIDQSALFHGGYTEWMKKQDMAATSDKCS